MRIEEITADNIKEFPDVELRNLKLRFIKIYDRYFVDPEMEKAVMKHGPDLDREMFYDKYMTLRMEMKVRKVTCMEGVAIDKEIDPRVFQKSVWGIDIPSLGKMMIVRSYISLSGAFIKSPLGVKTVEVVIRNLEENKDERLENKLTVIIKREMGKIAKFTYSPPGPDSSYMPVFDLILKPRDETRRIKPLLKVELSKTTAATKKTMLTKKTFLISKPEENEQTIRIPVGPACEVTATIIISADEGIKALYCGKEKKIRTYLFDKKVKAWTMVTARAWIKEHQEKVAKDLKKKLEKKLSDAQRKECDAETELIRENTKKAKYPHKFKAAKFTHPNGHPRCVLCGDEERVDAKDKQLPCEKPDTGSRRYAKFTITKIDKKQQIVGGVVYEPDEVDTQGDYTNKKEIEKAMYRFMEKYATNTKRIRINHQGKKIFFPIVESFIPEQDITKGGQKLKAGTWWMMIKITDKKIWDEIEKGTLTGFSMGGRAKG